MTEIPEHLKDRKPVNLPPMPPEGRQEWKPSLRRLLESLTKLVDVATDKLSKFKTEDGRT